MVADCGCWTDPKGYWHLSDKCLEDERRAWAHALRSARGYRLATGSQAKFHVVDGKLRLDRG